MRQFGLFSTVFLLAFAFMFFLIVFFNNSDDPVGPAMIATPEGGFIFNIESTNAKEYFEVIGWDFHGKFPIKLRKKARNLVKTRSVWIVQGKGSTGSISTTTNLQSNVTGDELQPVIVLIKYFITWGSGITVTGFGINLENGDLEAVEEKLVSAEGESTKTGFCRKLVYLGPVHEVKIEGYVTNEEEFALIDELQISVGKTAIEDETEELFCT